MPSGRASLAAVLGLLATASALAALYIALTGGGVIRTALFTLSARNITNPLMIATMCAALALWLSGETLVVRSDPVARGLERAGAALAILMAVAVLSTAVSRGIFVAAGADASGYLAQARLWRGGSLRLDPLIADDHIVTNGRDAFAPLGFRAAVQHGDLVPTYPPGYPLLMAVAHLVGGDGSQFLVTPLSAAGIVIVAFLLGRRVFDTQVGILTALACAVSPLVLVQAIQPMSDVPGTFWWCAGVLLTMYSSWGATLGAAAAVSIAALVRPNLFVMVPFLVIALWFWVKPADRFKHAASIAMGAVVTATVYLLWQRELYGSPAQSGYGRIADLFSFQHVWPNLMRYPRWLIELHSPVIALAVAGPALYWLNHRFAGSWTAERRLAVVVGFLGMCVVLLLFYLFYLPFEGWAFARFLLPGLPLLFLVAAAAAVAFVRTLPVGWHGPALLMVAIIVATGGIAKSRQLGFLNALEYEHRYVDVARFVERLPGDAVLVSHLHSGSLRYYTGRAVVRFDWLDPNDLDVVVGHLARIGRPVYLALDGVEVQSFCQRFRHSGTVRGMPRRIFVTPPSTAPAFVYDLSHRGGGTSGRDMPQHAMCVTTRR